MNIHVARKLHERRFRTSPVVTTGEMLNLIGSDGLQEALLNRWVVPENESGMLMLNMHGGKMIELENACRCRCGSLDCACGPETIGESMTAMPMREAFAGFGLERPPAAGNPTPTQAVMPRPQQPMGPTAAVSAPANSPQIGDEAMVTEQNKTFTGKVASVSQDGRYRLSFGSDKPSMDRDYGFNELRVVDKANA